jgi:hypothetical protein
MSAARAMVLVVDIANVMGSRPDGWWRDRAGAATRLMASLAPLVTAEVSAPDSPSSPDRSGRPEQPGSMGRPGSPEPPGHVDPSGPSVRIDRIVAVVEGRARTATAPAALHVVLAPADGDSTIVAVAEQVLAGAEVPLVVTADRGLRDRLPAGSVVAGPSWLLRLI